MIFNIQIGIPICIGRNNTSPSREVLVYICFWAFTYALRSLACFLSSGVRLRK